VAERLPLFPLGTVLFPGSAMPLHVFEPRYRQLVEDLLSGPEPRLFGVVAIRAGHEVGADNLRALYDVGCVAEVRQVERAPDGRFAVLVVGTRRFRLLEVDRTLPYLQADVDLLDEPEGAGTLVDAAAAKAREDFAVYSRLLSRPASGLPADPTELSYAVAAGLVVDLPERQQLLEASSTTQRLRVATDLMSREVALARKLRAAPTSAPTIPRHLLN
jgi:Lon protease-like protein